MPKATTIYDTLSYTEPITSSNPMVDVKKSLAQLDAPLKEIDDYDPLQINTLNVDRGVAGEYSNEQNNNISGLASSGDIWGAASKAKGLAKKSAREQKDIHHKAGAAAYNLTTQKADEARELKRTDVSGNVLNYNNLKSQRLYAREGGIGTYDESGRSTNLGGFNRYNSIISTPTKDTSTLIKKFEEGWKASGSTETTFGGQGTKYIDKTTNKIRYVKGKDVHSYVANGLLSDDQWVKSNSESIEADMYEKLAPSMGNDGAIDYLTSPEAQAQIQQQVADRANRQARGSSDKVGFYTNDESASRTNDASWGKSSSSNFDSGVSTFKVTGQAETDKTRNSAGNVENTIKSSTSQSENVVYEQVYAAKKALNPDASSEELTAMTKDFIISSGLAISKEDYSDLINKYIKKGKTSIEAEQLATQEALDNAAGKNNHIATDAKDNDMLKDLFNSVGNKEALETLENQSSSQEELLAIKRDVEAKVLSKNSNQEKVKALKTLKEKYEKDFKGLSVNIEEIVKDGNGSLSGYDTPRLREYKKLLGELANRMDIPKDKANELIAGIMPTGSFDAFYASFSSDGAVPSARHQFGRLFKLPIETEQETEFENKALSLGVAMTKLANEAKEAGIPELNKELTKEYKERVDKVAFNSYTNTLAPNPVFDQVGKTWVTTKASKEKSERLNKDLNDHVKNHPESIEITLNSPIDEVGSRTVSIQQLIDYNIKSLGEDASDADKKAASKVSTVMFPKNTSTNRNGKIQVGGKIVDLPLTQFVSVNNQINSHPLFKMGQAITSAKNSGADVLYIYRNPREVKDMGVVGEEIQINTNSKKGADFSRDFLNGKDLQITRYILDANSNRVKIITETGQAALYSIYKAYQNGGKIKKNQTTTN